MIIEKILIEGIANIEQIELDLQKFNALIALNNYGKSNLIAAIDFAVKFIKGTLQEKTQAMTYRPFIPINKVIQSKPFKFAITFSTNLDKEAHTAIYSFSFHWVKNDRNKGQKVTEESLKIKSNRPDSKYKTYLDRKLNETHYLTSSTGRCDKALKVGKDELAINKLANFELFYGEVISEINTLNCLVPDTLQDPDKMFRRINPNFIRTGYSLDIPSDYDVAFFVYSLKKNKRNLYELLIDSFKSLIPSIEDIDATEIDIKSQVKGESKLPLDFPEKLYDIIVKESHNNQVVPISNISSGSQKIFFVLAFAIACEINKVPLVAFEELENSLHPGLLQKFLIILDGLITNTKILLTSHSPYLIQYLSLDRIKIGIPNEKGLAIFKELKKSKYKAISNFAQENGISIGDFIFDKMIDATMGESDGLLDFCNG